MACLSGSCAVACAGPVTIDNFTQPNPFQYFAVGSGMDTSEEISETSSGAIGGQRDVLASVVGQAKPNSFVGTVGYIPQNAMNAVEVGTNGNSPTVATLQYSGIDPFNTSTSLVSSHGLGGGLGVDLTGGGTNTEFLLQFISSDAQPSVGLDVQITITSPGGKSSTVKGFAPNSPSSFNFMLPFFGPNGLQGNASLTDVTSITYVFNGIDKAPNVDWEIKSLAVTPEPGGAFLMLSASGLLGVAHLVRRRRKRNPAGKLA